MAARMSYVLARIVAPLRIAHRARANRSSTVRSLPNASAAVWHLTAPYAALYALARIAHNTSCRACAVTRQT